MLDKDKINTRLKVLGFPDIQDEELDIYIDDTLADLYNKCARTSFPVEAYPSIEKMVAYNCVIGKLNYKQLNESDPTEAKSISIENTKVDFVGDMTSSNISRYNKLFNDEYVPFVQRYRCLIWP